MTIGDVKAHITQRIVQHATTSGRSNIIKLMPICVAEAPCLEGGLVERIPWDARWGDTLVGEKVFDRHTRILCRPRNATTGAPLSSSNPPCTAVY
jgi:hypothetical protein